MKKKTGFSVAGVIVTLAIVAFLGAATYLVIDGNNKATNFNDYNFYSVIEADAHNGYIADHIKGYDPATGTVTDNPEIADKAPVIIYEYADYQCSGCAVMNENLNDIIIALEGKLAIVYRSFLLSYHTNATAAASAAEAAGLQGYWKAYADKLFSEQGEWFYATGSERGDLFNKYFVEVTGGKGDLEKFNSDIASENVSKKISFDMGIGQRMDIDSTPSLFIDGQKIDLTGGSITINGQTFTWEKNMTKSQLTELITNIVEAKLTS